jgi:hypothetical protein
MNHVFGNKTEEATAGWRKIHNEELYDLYFSLNTLRATTSRMRNEGGYGIMGET